MTLRDFDIHFDLLREYCDEAKTEIQPTASSFFITTNFATTVVSEVVFHPPRSKSILGIVFARYNTDGELLTLLIFDNAGTTTLVDAHDDDDPTSSTSTPGQ